MSVELGSVWIDNDSDVLVIVKSLEAKFDGKVTVIFNYIVRTGDKSIESASELELFLNTKTKLVRHNESDYSRGYEDGYNSGKNQWQDDYGFTVPNNTIQSLEKAAYAKGLKDKEGINNSVKYQDFKKGYDKAKELYESLHDWNNKEQFEAGLKEGKEFNKDDQNLNYRTGYNDGWHDCEASFELGNDFTDSIQEQAYDEGYDQAIDDLIKAGVIEEEEYSNEDDYSEYEFGDVEDGEEEYCFSKELDKILNGAFVVDTKSDDDNKEEMVNHPKHYNSDLSGVECIEVARYRNFNVGSALKYLWRCGLKNGNSDIQDLEKAVWYLNDEIKSLKRGR